MLHSADDQYKPLDPKRHVDSKQGDVKKTFVTDAAVHLVNRASVDELRTRVN